MSQRFDDTGVFEVRTDGRSLRWEKPQNGEVVRFGRAARERHFVRMSAEKSRDAFTSVVHCPPGYATDAVSRRWITVSYGFTMANGFRDYGKHGCGGVMVEVNRVHTGIVSPRRAANNRRPVAGFFRFHPFSPIGAHMTAQEVLAKLETLGSASTKKTLMRHGAREPFFGVKIGDMKTLVKPIKRDHALALELYDSGNTDAMYLAAMLVDPQKMTKPLLRKWANGAYWHMLSCYTVPWVASESDYGVEMALEWMDTDSEQIAAAGWSTYGCVVAIEPDADLNNAEIEKLLARVKAEIGSAPNRTKYAMLHFVIALGCYVEAFTAKAKAVAKAIGPVEIDVGDTDCKMPDAVAYIAKVEKMGRIGKKRKTAMC